VSSSEPDDQPFRDAEAWLAERGIEREPIRPDREPPRGEGPPAGGPGPGTPRTDVTARPGVAPTDPATGAPIDAPVDGPADGPADASTAGVTAREAGRLATQAAADAELRAGEASALPDPDAPSLGDDAGAAVAFVRSSTAATPQSEGRLRSKLADRGWPGPVIDAAMERARRERLVDDPAMAAALVAERRAKGHAPARIRRDLRDRGFDDPVIDTALGGAESEDQEAAAFAVASDKARRLTGVGTETAFRRVVGHVARRGYPEALARKVAREAVFTTRDEQRVAGH
jgi:regulatory protein